MNKLYRFSPIKDENTLQEAFVYITSELEKLSEKLLGQKLPINTLKIFPHYTDEYEYLYKLISSYGAKSSYSSETSLYVEVDKKINGHYIKYLGVRIVDPYRMQVGCGDYEVGNFEELRKKYTNSSEFIRDFRDGMLELWDPDFDILGYIVPSL